ncbi:MAG: hypothetical protein ACFB0Z_00215 [Candidatus Phaeomarinobacter sp.]
MIPTTLLLAAVVAGFLDRETPVSLLGSLSVTGLQFDPGNWFTLGHVWVFALFMIVNLTGRRHGASVATASVALAGALLGLVWGYAVFGDAHVVMPADMIVALGNQTMVLAVTLSVALGLLLNIVVFDLVRGRPWWKAPLLAPLFGGAAMVALFHALADSVLTGSYADRLVSHLAVVALATLLMVVVYHALRSVIQPRSGYGGA